MNANFPVQNLFRFLLVIPGILAAPSLVSAKEADRRDWATEVRAVFQAKCSRCHGPQVPKPKGKFGYVLDLKRLAADKEKVVPGQPENSQLWQLVSEGEMPPEESPTGPLTEEQKQTIHDWIAAGAPAAPPPSAESESESPPPPERRSFLDWLGRLHVLVVHFPIALLLAAALGEVWFAWRRGRSPASAVGFCILLGAISAVVSAALGWIHAANGHGAGSPFLPWHRWFGVATATGAVILAALSARDVHRGRRGVDLRLMLLLESILVAVTGDLGGSLVYGADFFRW